MTTSALPLSAAVDLAHALVAHVAMVRGIRVIFIKGPIATRQGLRDADYISGDVDAFCDPDHVDELVAALNERGWYLRPESEGHAKFVTHSITLIHDQWPCDIDVHTSYPGFLAPPRTVFEALWTRCEPHDVAEVECYAPAVSAQTVVLLLHGLRAPYLPKNIREIEAVRSRLENVSDGELAEIMALIRETGAAEVVHDTFSEMGHDLAVPRHHTVEYLKWRLVSQPSRTEGWVEAVAETRGRARLTLLYRAVLPTREHLAIDHPEATISRMAAVRAYRTRLLRAARLLPAAVRNVIAAKRAKSHVDLVVPTQLGPGIDQVKAVPVPSPVTAGAVPLIAGATVSGQVTAPPDVAPVAVFVSPETEGPNVGKAFVLPLATSRTQVPLEVNEIGLDLLALLQSVEGDLDTAVVEAQQLWGRTAEELRPVIEEFRGEMVRAGALTS